MPPRDWKKHWHSYLGHALLGVLSAVMILDGWEVSGTVITACYLTYQYVEFLRRGDTPARDIADFILGQLPVLCVGYVVPKVLG